MMISRFKVILFALLAVVGTALGFVLFNVLQPNWWYQNRLNYAQKLMTGSFSLALTFLLQTLTIMALLFLSAWWQRGNFLCYVTHFGCFVYFGATMAGLFSCATFWALLYLAVVQIVWMGGCFVACFTAQCVYSCQRTCLEALRDLKQAFALLTCAFLAKIVCFFVLLAIITAFI